MKIDKIYQKGGKVIKERLYFAYGSNMNLDQMEFRCPDAEVIGNVMVKDKIDITATGSIIGDIYTLDEAIAPNQMNFLTWGNVTFPSAGKIRIEVKGQKVEMNYPLQFKAELETIKLDDPRLSNVWGKEIYRITLKTEEKKVTGKYGFVIQQVK